MSRTKMTLQALGGMTLAFLIGVSAMAAQDAAKPAPAAPQAQAMQNMAGQPAAAPHHTYAPGLPGWMKHLPTDQQETARKLWLTDGRTILATKELLVAKRHELNAQMAMPGVDEKTVNALVKEVAALNEKLITAEISLRRKLEKEGIATWGRMDDGGMMGNDGCKMMDGMKDGMMGGMMKGMSHDGAAHDGKAATPATPAATGHDNPSHS